MVALQPAFEVTYAPRTETLLDALAAVVSEPLHDPIVKECIVVHNLGMARWLELQLAARLGVWANPWFPFPEALVYRLWRSVCREDVREGAGRFDLETLTWSVAAALPRLVDEPVFAPLRDWLGAAREPARMVALAGRIATVFNRYVLDRPDFVLGWENDPDGDPLPIGVPPEAAEDAAWQAALWRAVVAPTGSSALVATTASGEVDAPGSFVPTPAAAAHPARRTHDLIACLTTEPDVARRLYRFPRVSVFGLSALSPTYIRVFAALARHVPVHIFTLAPSPDDAARTIRDALAADWGDLGVVAPSGADAAARLAALPDVHPLLESQAAPVRRFQMLLALAGANAVPARAPVPTPPEDEPERRPRPSLLARLQSDIIAGGPPRRCPSAVAAAARGVDRSIGLHSCHGPLREVEVLRDQILAAFDEVEGLAPHDIVVMVPDVEQYAPYVEAVFGVGAAEGTAIPFRVADRLPQTARPGIQAFDRALHVVRGRMTAPEVLDLLGLPSVRDARGLDEEGVEDLRGWVEEVGIRWGIDGVHRASVGQPALDANTWQWGLTRLALGWAAPGDGRARFLGVLPFAPAGAEPAPLGALADFVASLVRWRDELLDARWPMKEWADRLSALASELLGAGPDAEDDRVLVEATLGDLARGAAEAGFDADLDLDAVTVLAGEILARDPPARGFLEGAVTVCALQPMRAVPFRVVALVGMNDGAFPRTDRPPGFDLAARVPRLGDNPRRDADRLLFLEAVLCARDRLIVTWTGQDPRTDADLAPSVVVSEFLDVLVAMGTRGEDADGSWTEGAEGDAREDEPEEDDRAPQALAAGLVVSHALHPFSRRYFEPDGDPRWFSYASGYAATAGSAGGPRRPRRPLAPHPLPPSVEDGEDGEHAEWVVRLDALARFLEAPARRFVTERLRIDLPERGAPLPDREPMALDPLDRWQVGESILSAILAGASTDEAVAVAAAAGRLPLGTPGKLAVQPLDALAERLADLSAPLRTGGPARVTPIDLIVRVPAAPAAPAPTVDVRIVGSLDGLWPAGRLEVGYGRLDERRELRLWVRHLVLNVAVAAGAVTGCEPVSWAVGRATARDKDALGVVRLAPVPSAERELAAILALWLEADTTVPPFYPRAARTYVDALLESRPGGAAGVGDVSALRKAAEAFGAGRREEDADRPWRQAADLDDAYLALALGDALPWDDDGEVVDEAVVTRFRVLARSVFEPLERAAERWVGDEARARLGGLGLRT